MKPEKLARVMRRMGQARRVDCLFRSEPVEKTFEIFQLFFGAFTLAGPTPDFIQQFTRAAIDVFALQHALVRANLAIRACIAAQRIALLARIGAVGHALLAFTLLLLLGHRLAEIAHAFAQSFHRFGLVVDGAGKIVLTQGLFGTLHRSFGAIKRFACRVTGL